MTRVCAAVAAGGLLAACATAPPPPEPPVPGFEPPAVPEPELAAEVRAQTADTLRSAVETRARLLRIGYTLTTAAAPFCGELTLPRVGAVIGDDDWLESDVAKEVARDVAGIGDRVSVIAVVPGGPFERAGIRAGDAVVAVDGEAIGETREFHEQVSEAGAGPVSIDVQRRAARSTHAVELERACPLRIGLATSPMILPWKATPLVVAAPVGLLKFASDDDELAALLGHQMAHQLFDPGEREDLESERRADLMGLFIAARAGFDVSRAPGLWERVAAEYPWLITPRSRRVDRGFRRYPHQGIALRLERIHRVVEDIARRQATGRPLVPWEE